MWVAISQRGDPNKFGDKTDNLENNYINYLESFGIKLVIIPNSSKNVEKYFKEFPISAVILSGGNDVDPKLYEKDRKGLSSISIERDKTEKRLLELAIKNKLPTLGICRGMQFINVFFKGKLIKDIKGEMGKNHNHVKVDHQIDIIDDKSKMILGNKAKVNSYHNQGVNSETLSSELKVFAKSKDGIVEGFYHPTLPIAGIQWHPERKSPDEEVNSKIIDLFLNKKLFWKK